MPGLLAARQVKRLVVLGSAHGRANGLTETLASVVSTERQKASPGPDHPSSNVDTAGPPSIQQTSINGGPNPAEAPMAGMTSVDHPLTLPTSRHRNTQDSIGWS